MASGLERGLAVLLALEGGAELGVTGIAGAVGREKSQVSRTLKVLAEHGLVERDPDSLAYRLGWRLYALAAAAGDERLAAAAPDALRGLVERLGEVAHLCVLQDVGVLTVMSESPPHAVQAVNWVGRVVPVAGASAGYALLLDHERGELARFGDPGALWRRIRDARTRGFALVDEEFEPGLVAVGAPVRDFRGRIVAAVNVSAPKFRFGARLEQAGEEVRAVADDLSRSLGWTP